MVCLDEDFKLVTDYSLKAPELEALAQMHPSGSHVPGRREHGRNHLRAAAQECETRPAHPHPGHDTLAASLCRYLLSAFPARTAPLFWKSRRPRTTRSSARPQGLSVIMSDARV